MCMFDAKPRERERELVSEIFLLFFSLVIINERERERVI